MNRAERRQVKLGRAPIVVALPTTNPNTRVRKITVYTRKLCEMVQIDNGRPEDSKLVVKLMQDHFTKTGHVPLCIDPASPMLIARHKITQEGLGFLSIKPIPPGKMYIENFHVIPGRLGKAASRALAERVMAMGVKKVCMLQADNVAMLRVLEHYGGRVVGYLVEGPYSEQLTEPAAAAPVMEAVT
jgi:hypothetical protein